MCRLPLCTPNVIPTISGVIVDRRDQVRIAGGFAPPSLILLSVRERLRSTNGPFFNERGIYLISNYQLRITIEIRNLKFVIRNYFRLLSRTIISLVRLLRRVLYPRVGWPQGVTG